MGPVLHHPGVLHPPRLPGRLTPLASLLNCAAARVSAGMGNQSGTSRLVGPAELPTDKKIKDLTHGETIEHPDVFPCLSHRVVSNNDALQASDFAPLEHSVYIGRRRLGRYTRVSLGLYAAYDACNRQLGRFTKRADALAAIDC